MDAGGRRRPRFEVQEFPGNAEALLLRAARPEFLEPGGPPASNTARSPRDGVRAGPQIHALDPGLAPQEIITMREQVDRSTSAQRIAVVLLGVFGGLALVLAAIGLYGVMSYAVSQSTRELGLRMALGADASDVLRLVISRGLRLTIAGVIIGMVAALAVSRLLGQLLYY